MCHAGHVSVCHASHCWRILWRHSCVLWLIQFRMSHSLVMRDMPLNACIHHDSIHSMTPFMCAMTHSFGMSWYVCHVSHHGYVCHASHRFHLPWLHSTQTHRHRDTQTHRHRDTQTRRHRDTQTHSHIAIQSHTSSHLEWMSHGTHEGSDGVFRTRDIYAHLAYKHMSPAYMHISIEISVYMPISIDILAYPAYMHIAIHIIYADLYRYSSVSRVCAHLYR